MNNGLLRELAIILTEPLINIFENEFLEDRWLIFMQNNYILHW